MAIRVKIRGFNGLLILLGLMEQALQRTFLEDETATAKFAASLLPLLHAGDVVYLQGDLGAGKTTLTRALLRLLAYTGTVNSPTYTLIESYQLPPFDLHHFDLYRLKSADELEALGARDLFDAGSVCMIEWPQNAQDWLPGANIVVEIEHAEQGRWVQVQNNKLD